MSRLSTGRSLNCKFRFKFEFCRQRNKIKPDPAIANDDSKIDTEMKMAALTKEEGAKVQIHL